MTIPREEALTQIDRAMVRIRRSQTKRTIGRLMDSQLKVPFDPAHGIVVDALEELSAPGAELPSVGGVAEQLGIDPSRASRMVASAVRAGYVKRVASQADSRRTCLELTALGRNLLRTARRFRTQVFAQQMETWPDRDCAEFARLLSRFTADAAGG